MASSRRSSKRVVSGVERELASVERPERPGTSVASLRFAHEDHDWFGFAIRVFIATRYCVQG
jgi:hypothetical protein